MYFFIKTLFLITVLGVSLTAQASSISSIQNLFFGTWVPSGSSGNITISTSGTTTSNGVSRAPSSTLSYQAILKFTSTGLLGSVLDIITITPIGTSTTLSNGTGGTVSVNNFVPQTGLGVSLLNPTINIPMGGTLSFSGTPSGTYSGSIQVQGSGLLSGTATTTVPISVIFWRVLTLAQQTHLNFGTIETRGGNAVVRITPQTGARSIISGSSNISLVSTPTPTAGAFLATGQPNTEVTVTLPNSTVISGSNGGSMTVNNFKSYPNETTLDSSGNLSLKIGADLSIATNQQAGTYTGTYQLIINY